MQCHYCGWRDNRHAGNCPEEGMKGMARVKAMQRWSHGYEDGRRGKPKAADDAHYSMGWVRGDVAADAAANP